MDDGQDREEEERPRPRVVDKRVSARGADGGSTPVVDVPEPEPPETTPAAEPREQARAEEAPGVWTPEQEEQARQLAEELARAPGRDLVVTFAMNFVEAASVKVDAGDLEGARLAIDAFDAIVKTLGTRLGDAEAPLKSVLAQLQMAYAQRATRMARP